MHQSRFRLYRILLHCRLGLLNKDRDDEHRMIRDLVVHHVGSYPESLTVVEEYDKMACETRSMLRQVLQHPEVCHYSHLLLIGSAV